MASNGSPVKNGHAMAPELLSLANNDRMQDFEDGGDLSPNSKQQRETGDDRVKRRALRPSERAAVLNGIGAPPNGLVEVLGSAGRIKVLVNGNKFAKNSRRPRGRYGRGLPKKGGAGGKGTWGAPGSELVGVEHELEDPHDPNYDSDTSDTVKFEAITPPLNEDEVEKHVSPIISEYFEHGDTDEAIYALEELNLSGNEYQIAVIAVSLAMERKGAHRELTSVLISDMYSRVLAEEDIERTFDVLLKGLPDLILDTPTACDVLGSFIARAVADDCIPPAYVNRNKEIADSELVQTAIEHALALLTMKHGLVKLDTVWGVTGGMRPVKYLVRQIQFLLREYLSSNDLKEAVRCLQELEVPHFHHELVYEAVMMAIEDTSDRTMDLICSLLKSMATSVIITPDQLKAGFLRVYEEMPDISIDVPHAYPLLEKFVHKVDNVGILSKELKQLPSSRGRKRFVSEGDGGLVKENGNGY